MNSGQQPVCHLLLLRGPPLRLQRLLLGPGPLLPSLLRGGLGTLQRLLRLQELSPRPPLPRGRLGRALLRRRHPRLQLRDLPPSGRGLLGRGLGLLQLRLRVVLCPGRHLLGGDLDGVQADQVVDRLGGGLEALALGGNAGRHFHKDRALAMLANLPEVVDGLREGHGAAPTKGVHVRQLVETEPPRRGVAEHPLAICHGGFSTQWQPASLEREGACAKTA
mmetsp:Transcript_27299/g.55203  ORF Transcript_27299/g.55203 Transcript_27299/m.55203 type:complete len:221 (+) Transcript_27299:221-883(+)